MAGCKREEISIHGDEVDAESFRYIGVYQCHLLLYNFLGYTCSMSSVYLCLPRMRRGRNIRIGFTVA